VFLALAASNHHPESSSSHYSLAHLFLSMVHPSTSSKRFLSFKLIRQLEAVDTEGVDTAAIFDADKATGSNAVKLLSSSMKLRNRNLADMPNRKIIGIARIVQLSHRQDFLAVLQGLDQSVKEGKVVFVFVQKYRQKLWQEDCFLQKQRERY